MAVLRTAQAFGLGGGIEGRARAAGPHQLPPRGFEARSLARRGDRQQPALALDHHPPRLAQRGGDQRDPRGRIGLGDGADPFGARAGLAEAAPRHDQPQMPGLGRGQLAGMRPELPVAPESGTLGMGQPLEFATALLGLEPQQHLGAVRPAHERGSREPVRACSPGQSRARGHARGSAHWPRGDCACRR